MQAHVLLMIILIPFIGALFTMGAKHDKNYVSHNIYYVAIWAILANVLLILYVFSTLNADILGIQIIEKYFWLTTPQIDILFGADIFSMLLLLGVNAAFLIGCICTNHYENNSKSLLISGLCFISAFNGYILSADIISFYVFFSAISIPITVMVSDVENVNKKNIFIRYSMYNFIGALLLFLSIITIYCHKNGNIPLNIAGNTQFENNMENFVWICLFWAFISRIPIWPLHYWMSSINTTLKNPLVIIISNILPLTGLYGFMRFWPNTLPENISVYAPFFEILSIITMIFVSLMSLSAKELKYKLFAYTTIYYLLYLIGSFLPTNGLKMNIGHSLFAYIFIITVLSFLICQIDREAKKVELYTQNGILCYMPKTSLAISLFVLAGIGLPITALFWNNFIIISEIFNYSLLLGILTMLSLFIVALSLLISLYIMKDKACHIEKNREITDISEYKIAICILCLIALLFSFFKPLWFIF